MDDADRREDERGWEDDADGLEHASENVLEGWPSTSVDESPADAEEPAVLEPEAPENEPDEGRAVVSEPDPEPKPDATVVASASEHAPGDLVVPPGYPVLEGEPRGGRRAVGVVVSRFNGDVTGRLLGSALEELAACGVEPGSITVMPVPGAFELPLAAMALAKTRRFSCVVALGCVIRGDTPHFDYVASEAASGLQLAAIETGVPVSFGVLTLDRLDQAAPRVDKGAEAVRTALEMADLFSNLRAAAAG
ncbi:MAG: 6,7-dimethyl-8-ribityllumazine synthase [Gaiella sp.]|nr:6,7-dimethyl-8-ribityllumazine synthase [Gaiella sp.]